MGFDDGYESLSINVSIPIKIFKKIYTIRCSRTQSMEEFNHHHHNHTLSSSSTYTYFSDQAAKEGLWNGTSMRRSPVDTREEIQIELQKERIREQIVAKEIARIRDLDAELKRETAMHNGAGFPSNYRLQPVPSEEKYRRHRPEIAVVPFHRQHNVNYMGNGSSELNHRSSEFWNQNGSRVYGESQSWGFREGPWGR